MTDPLLVETAVNILNKMMLKDWFDICSLNAAAKLLDVKLTGEAAARLEKLHCVHWNDMPKALRDEVPQLIAQALACEAFRFDFLRPAPANSRVIDATPTRKPSLFRLLAGKSTT